MSDIGDNKKRQPNIGCSFGKKSPAIIFSTNREFR
jgi:hypothetical protein